MILLAILCTDLHHVLLSNAVLSVLWESSEQSLQKTRLLSFNFRRYTLSDWLSFVRCRWFACFYSSHARSSHFSLRIPAAERNSVSLSITARHPCVERRGISVAVTSTRHRYLKYAEICSISTNSSVATTRTSRAREEPLGNTEGVN